MKNQVVKIEAPELSLIEGSKAAKIKATFEPMVIMLEGFEESYNEIIKEAQKGITPEIANKARVLRLEMVPVRTDTGRLKDTEKEEHKRAVNAIQSVHNIIVWALTDKELKLKEIENHEEILRKERLAALQLERVNLLSQYVQDAQERNLSSMEDDVWEAYLAAKKQAHIDLIAAEKQAEVDRLAVIEADKKERLRIEAENEQLKQEAVERERVVKIEREKLEKEAQLRNEQARKEHQARVAKEKEEQDAREAAAKIEREKRQALEAQVEAAEQAKREAIEQHAARVQSELNKGDADKVNDLKNDLAALKSKYNFDSVKNKTMYKEVGLLIDKIINHIK